MGETKKPSGRKGCLLIFAIACIVGAGPAWMLGMMAWDGEPVIVKVRPALTFFAIGVTILLVIGYRGYRNRKR